MRRSKAIPLVLVVVLATSGCLQVVSGGPITFEASQASVADAELDEHDYELANESTFTVDREVDLPAVGTRQVRITNHIGVYSRLTGEAPDEEAASAFFLLSTPKAEVLGQGTNPLGRAPLKEVASQVASRSGEQSDIEEVDTRTLTVLGTETEAKKFRSTTTVEGESVSTFVYVTRVAHGDDYVIAVAVLPAEFEDVEDDVYGLMEGIEHETDG